MQLCQGWHEVLCSQQHEGMKWSWAHLLPSLCRSGLEPCGQVTCMRGMSCGSSAGSDRTHCQATFHSITLPTELQSVTPQHHACKRLGSL